MVEEDKVEPSDVYLWWGGEPNSDNCYAFLTLFFEVDPQEIGTPRFDERVLRNLALFKREHKLAPMDHSPSWLASTFPRNHLYWN